MTYSNNLVYLPTAGAALVVQEPRRRGPMPKAVIKISQYLRDKPNRPRTLQQEIELQRRVLAACELATSNVRNELAGLLQQAQHPARF